MRPARFGVKRGVDGRESLRYAAGVLRNTSWRVEIANRSRDRPRLALVLATALGALGAGLAAGYGLRHATEDAPAPAAAPSSLEHQRDAGPSSVASAGIATSARPDASAVAEAAADRDIPSRPDAGLRAPAENAEPMHAAAPVSPSTRDASPSEPGPGASDATPASPRPPRTRAHGRVQHGIIAYIRCDGLRPLRGRFPCPRDLELERQVSTILDRLQSCSLLQDQSGNAEIRLELTRDGASPPRASAPKEGGLDPQSVLRCASAALSKLQTALDPDRMIVRFRFELR